MTQPNPRKTAGRAGKSAGAGGDASGWQDRRMIRGKWQDPEAAKKEPRADRTISVRLTEAELAELDAQISGLSLNRNRALRIAARRIGGFLEVDGATVEALRTINRQLAGVATNINQIAHSANRTHDPDYRAFMAQRAELGRVLIETRGALQRILDLGARREDGLARLKAAAEPKRAGGAE
ncbi:type IV secretion system T-DNA border endonuclease VirD1 [Amaricoccus macauensis]|uniref:Type IV secretion system T-DNA border endonuclease VirD1 n=1 Tax=Amaricoccus macauensis TaxID=57001 RepID=A0A840SUW3_9RHOB|nr:DNA mobilization endonuclease VirD1/MobC family subunit [Amaricoccus macauensis]MBB5224518.1 type IV secretion system T-DNA border endonuclease VirD1 [Amaricoccus macauensis]